MLMGAAPLLGMPVNDGCIAPTVSWESAILSTESLEEPVLTLSD